jgi:hypothetical protein
MGWLFPYHTSTKASLVEDVTKEITASGNTIVATKSVGKGLWMLVTPKNLDKPIIVFYLMEKVGTWGYKDMDESMHPYYYDCPVAWLEKAPVLSQPWRDGVMAHINKKIELKEAAKKIVANKAYRVKGSWKFRGYPLTELYVTSTNPCLGRCNGDIIKISRKLKAALEELP